MLTISGTSLDGDEKVEVKVDGVPCLLQSYDETSIVCETLPKLLGDPKVLYAGEHGLQRSFYNKTGANENNYESKEGEHSIMTNFELGYYKKNQYTSSYNFMKGFFEAPIDGKYQFKMAGDDAHWVYMSIPETESTDDTGSQES